jgi:hypothetical protein
MSIRSRKPGHFETNEIEQTRTATHELRRIKNKLSELITTIGGGGGLPAGLATETKQDDQITELSNANSTLTSILNNIVASQDVEIILVRDTGNGDIIVQQIREYDQGTGLWTTRYEDVNGANYVPVGPLEYIDASAVLNLVLAELIALNATDFATETTLASILSDTTSIDGKVATEVTLAALLVAFNAEDFASETTLASLAATDFATETTLATLAGTDFATQTTLADLNTKFNTLGQKASAASAPVVLSSEQETILDNILTQVTNINGNVGDVSTETTLSALLTAFNTEDFASEVTLTAINNKLNTLGQKASASSTPVVLSTEQEALLNDVLTALGDLDTLLTSIDGKDFATQTTLAALNNKFNTLGKKTEANSHPVVIAAEQQGILDDMSVGISDILLAVGDVSTETTLAAIEALLTTIDADTSNLDVALSTVATEVTLNALLTAFNAEDFASQTTLAALLIELQAKADLTETQPVSIDKATTGTLSSVNDGTSDVQLLASNTSRVSAKFFNESTSILYLAEGSAVSTTSYTVQIPAGGFYVTEDYNGEIRGIWSADTASGAVRITELT